MGRFTPLIVGFLIGLCIVLSVYIILQNYASSENIIVVNGTITRFYLGDEIFSIGYHHYFFHGIQWEGINDNRLVISHFWKATNEGGSSNMYVQLYKESTFRINSQSFLVNDFADSWIDLEKVLE